MAVTQFNPFLTGSFAPVREEATATELAVTGTIPEYLDGLYVRNGPNAVDDRDPLTYHLFSGDGMVHGVCLRHGRAEWYRNRWVRTPRVSDALGEPRFADVGVDPGEVSEVCNISVVSHAGRILALMEGGPKPYELTDRLDTVGRSDFHGTLVGGYTAHPHRDPVTGELHAVSYGVEGGRLRYTVLGVDGRIRRSVDVEVSGTPMVHDFGLTENHVVLFDLPVTADAGAVARPPDVEGVPYSWDPDRPARVGVLPRDAAPPDVRWFEVEPCWVFHPLNAYEQRTTPDAPVDRIVVDLCRYPSMFTTKTLAIDAMATLDRWTIDLSAGRVTEERLDDRVQDFPRIDERLTGRPHRYGYTIDLAGRALLKRDVVARTTVSRTFGASSPGEFVFVPSSDSGGEDDGVLMGLVQPLADDPAELVLLDASTLEPVASVRLPGRVPLGFHGNWLPATELAASSVPNRSIA